MRMLLSLFVAIAVLSGCTGERGPTAGIHRPRKLAHAQPPPPPPPPAPEVSPPPPVVPGSSYSQPSGGLANAPHHPQSIGSGTVATTSPVDRAPAARLETATSDTNALLPLCPANHQRLSAEDCQLFAAGRVRDGVAAFKPPRDMIVGQHQSISFAIVAGTGEAAAGELVSELGARAEDLATRATQIGRYMTAQLEGDPHDWRITPPDPVFQDIGLGSAIRWTWDVEALSPGHHELRLKLLKYADAKATVLIETVPVPPSKIHVKVGLRGSYSGFWDQVDFLSKAPVAGLGSLVVLLGVIGGVIVAIRKLRKTAVSGTESESAPPAQNPG